MATSRLVSHPDAWLRVVCLAVVSGVALLAAATLVGLDVHDHAEHAAHWLPGCAFREWLGMVCPGCGMTRAFLWLGRLDPARAFAAHPLSLPLLATMLWFGVGAPGWGRVAGPWVGVMALWVVLGTWLARLAAGLSPGL